MKRSLLILGLLFAGCTAAPPGGDDADPAQAAPPLESLPAHDVPWSDALLEAKSDERLPDLLARVERISAEHPERWEPAWIVAECLYWIQRNDEALQAGLRALELARRSDDAAGVSRVSHRLGWLARRQARPEEAEARFLAGLEAARDDGRSDLAGHSLNGLGAARHDLGDHGGSLDAFREAVDAFRDAGMDTMARRARANIAALLVEVGDAVTVERNLLALHAALVADGDTYQAARTAMTLGKLYGMLERYDDALEWYARVPREEKVIAARADFRRGRLALRRLETEQARTWLERAAAQQDDRLCALWATTYLAEVDMRVGDLDAARARLLPVIDESTRSGADETDWMARWLLGRTWLVQGDSRRAVAPLREAVARLERGADTLDPLAEGLRFLRERSAAYSELAVALRLEARRTGTDAASEIVDVVERTHARALRRALGERAGERPELDLAALRRSLDPDELLLDYLIGEDAGVVVAVRQDRVRVFATAGWRELRGSLRTYRSALQRPLRSAEARLDPLADLERSMPDGRRVASLLLGPIESMLDGVRRLYVVPDRDIALLPLAALPWPVEAAPTRFLGEEIDVALLPLLGAPPRWDGSFGPLLLAGDPLPDARGEFPRLQRAAGELRDVSEVWGDGVTGRLAAETLTADRLLAQPLASFRTIHFATHAVASATDPRHCAVHLSKGRPLNLEAIAGLPLDSSPLVVLAACRTGAGELVPGEGVVGLGWAFLRAGSRGVVTSLWNVDDDSARELMVAFHRGLREGSDPVRALSEAARGLAGQRPHPAYWAPFLTLLRPEATG